MNTHQSDYYFNLISLSKWLISVESCSICPFCCYDLCENRLQIACDRGWNFLMRKTYLKLSTGRTIL